ncbi:protein phosphatase 1 regulatory subunit 12A-like [Asterias rubens]|uniref:protein phosphatase 1 regulatory subunit 12A-like n=1 Tax=Asterias rubens TaxID=7604 RepID=UPI001455CAA6|nr:protein phosphatase 1 regulatory subunit 12A-like [Asterias rubens]
MAHPDELELTDALFQAIEQDRFRLAESLLKKGASPNLILSSGISPFHLAIGADTSNTLDFVKLLLEHDGNPNIRSEDGLTPVHVAATWGRYQALSLLLRNGGNPDLCDEEGATAIDLANEQGNTECYNVMRTYKPDEEQEEPNEQSLEDDNVFTEHQTSGASRQSFREPHPDHNWQFSNSSLDCLQDSTHQSLDSTGLSDYLQESCISCSSYSAAHTEQDKKYLSRSFFPDLVPSIGAEADNYFEPSEGDFCHPKLKTARREYFRNENFRTSFGVTGTRNKSSGTSSIPDFKPLSHDKDSEKMDTKLREHSKSTNNKASFEVGEKTKPRTDRRTLSEPKQVLVGQSECRSEILETTQREKGIRSNLTVGGRKVPSRRIFSESTPVFKESERCLEIFKGSGNSPVSVLQDEDDTTDESELSSCDRTLSSKELEEALSESCHGLDLTSPDHPTVFTKICSSQSGETPPLDKTVIYIPSRRSTALINKSLLEEQSTEVSLESRVSNTSDESSAYVTCQSDDMFSCNSKKQIPDKSKRNSRRVTFSDDSESFMKVPKTTHCNEARDMDVRRSDQDKMQGKNLSQQTSQQDQRQFVEEASSSLEDSLITSDEDSLLPSREQYESSCRQGSQVSDDYGCATTIGRVAFQRCETSEDPQSLNLLRPGNVSEQEDIETLYHDPQTGTTLIERQCPSAMSTHQDMSVLEYSIISSDDTMLYDWRDFQMEEDDEQLEAPSLSQELLELTDNGIREMMRKYGEEAGPITSTTRLVYLRHLAKMQEDPSFAKRAASRHNTEGFRWELAEYLNTGHLKESHHTMVAEEQLMVAPFQIPDQSRKWREGTLKSSFNYLLLDPRVTMDLPGRYTQLTELETFRVFVAATFYIGKGKRGRPYAHFYEALSSMKPPKDKDADKSAKAAKKQPGAKVNHILDIWSAGLGVVSLHCFQSVIPVEAYAREACMVEAVGLSRLTNIKKGDFYGPSSTWPVRQRRQMGVFLLKKACQIFLIEGERQIRPVDIAVGQ